MRVDTLTPVLDAAPGELVVGRVRVVNDGDADAVFTMRVVGLDGGGVVFEVPGGPVGPGGSAEVEVPLDVPAALGVGQHAVALEVSSDRPDDRPALARLTVSVDSLERVQMAPSPSTVRGGRTARFTLDLVNNEPSTVDIVLGGGAPDVEVGFEPSTLRLRSGERGWVRGRIRARQRWGGESVHHVIELTARGRSSTASTTMAYLQRPVIPGKARNAVLGMFIVLLFIGLIGGGLWWWSQRDTADDIDARRSADQALDPIEGTTGEPGAPGAPDAPGAPGAPGDDAVPGADPPSGPGAIPTFTVVTGTVTVADGDSSGVTVQLAPIDLGGVRNGDDGDGEIVAFAGRQKQRGKIWSARHADRRPGSISPVRETESVPPITTDDEGVWRFVDVPIRGNYELTFSKPGYNRRSYVLTPPDDGSRVDLDVELEPGEGALSGVVIGPDGPLGGVGITVTDGDLTFRTTSATAAGAGQVGSFAIEGLSTPAVYTLTAELRGFGTEVVQLPFGAGQRNDGVTVQMREGVGSISGRITSAAQPRGGVTITASDGDDTFTTTSLTEGDVGFYSIPRLDIPGEYTVTAAVDGFITQTRRVTLTGNTAGVDFELTPTTAAITGRVVSDNGNPIVGAGVAVSIDEISVRSSTAAAPVPGTFNVDDLPPGTYLVRISRFDHLPFAQQVTVGAGETVDLGTIEMEFTERPPIPALGSVAVRVLDSEDQELEGATVSLYALDAKPGEDEPLRTITDEAGEQSNFVFENVPVGTYRVRVTRPIYRSFERRVSVGLARESMEARLFRLGQASGQLVTNGGQPLRDYEVTIFRVDGPGVESFVESRVVLAGAQPEDGEILWESAPNSLITGLYRLEVTRQPPGYVVSPDQIIDQSVEESPAAMLFRVPPDSEEPVRIDDLVADPYPLLGGRFFVPQFDGQTTTLTPLDETDVAAIDDLEVTLVCGSQSGTASIPPVDNREQVRPYPGFVLESPANHFEFTPFQLQSQQLVGSGCVLEVSADGYLDTTVTLASAIVPTPGAPDPRQRTINVALIEEVDPFFGDVGWVDTGPGGAGFIPLGGVAVEATDAITGSTPRQGDTFAQTIAPRIDRSTLSTTSAADGTWQLDGQVYGAAVYRFDDPRFGQAEMRVVVDDDGRDVTSLTGTGVQDRGPDGWRVILTEPLPGDLRGQVGIVTTAQPDFAGVSVSGDGPGGASFGPFDLANLAGNPRAFEVEVAAGNWQVDFGLPDNHAFFSGAPDRVTQLVEPDGVRAGFDTTMVELGLITLDVELEQTPGAPQPTGDAGSYELRPRASTDPFSSGDFDEQVVIANIPVHPTNPLVTRQQYVLDVLQVGYDEATADVTITTDAGTSAVPPDTPPPSASLDIALDLYAGTQASVTVELDQYGTLTGTVLGQTFPGNDTVLYFDPESDTDLLEVEATGVDSADVAIDPGRILVYPTESDDTSFLVTGPPGTYDITVSHPAYEAEPIERPTVPPIDPLDDPVPAQFDVANLTAETIDDDWVLRALTGTIELTALGSYGPPDPDTGDSGSRELIDGASVTISRPSDSNFVPVDVVTDENGFVEIDDLVPGTYRLEVRRRVDARDIAYPVIAELVVPTGSSPEARTVEVTVKMPSLAGSITGELTAENSLGEAVDAPSPVDIARAYTPTGVQIVTGGGAPTTTDNQAADGDVDAPAADAEAGEWPFASKITATVDDARDLENPYGFGFVPGGTHTLTFAVPDGYSHDDEVVDDEDPDTRTVEVAVNVDDVSDGDDKTVDLGYTALDVTVVVDLAYPSSVSNPDPTVRFESTLDDPIVFERVAAADPTVWTAAVPPRTTDYTLVIVDEFASPSDDEPITVTVTPSADTLELDIDMDASKGQITGTAQQQDSDRNRDLRGPATFEIRRGGDAPRFVPVADGAIVGAFKLDVDDGGPHTVLLHKDGYVSDQISINVSMGNPTPLPRTLVVVEKHRVEIPIAAGQVDGTTVTAVPFSGSPAVNGEFDANVWKAELVPGSEYRFRIDRPNHYSTFLPPPTQDEDEPVLVAPIGTTRTFDTVTLIDRLVTISVAGVNSPDPGNGNGDPVELRVELDIDGTTYVATPDAAVSGATAVEFRSTATADPDADPAIPAMSLTAGATRVQVSAPGHRTQVFTPATWSNGDWPISAYDDAFVAPAASQSDRSQSLSATLRPNVTTVSGTVTGVGAGVDVTLSECDGQDCTVVDTVQTVDDDSTIRYTFSPPADPGHFIVGSYLVEIDVPGTGSGSQTFDITPTSPTTAAVTVDQFAVTAQDATVTVTVSGPTSGVEIFDGSTNMNATLVPDTTQWEFDRTETAVEATYEVRADGYVWTTFEVDSVPASRQITESVTLPSFPDFEGTITEDVPDNGGTSTVGAADAAVEVFRGACDNDGATSTDSLGSDTTGSGGGYTVSVTDAGGATGDYCVTASKNGKSGFGTSTVSISNGVASASTTSFKIE